MIDNGTGLSKVEDAAKLDVQLLAAGAGLQESWQEFL